MITDHSVDNHVRADSMNATELLEDKIKKLEWFAKEVFRLTGTQYVGPCPCHSFLMGSLALDELKKWLVR
jgi:hypothetical protein